jgi:phosphatidate cytidylyltransferase
VKQRVLTSLILAPVVLLATFVASPYPFFVACLVVTTLAFWELRTMLGGPRALPVLTLVGLALPFFGTEIQTNRDPLQIGLYSGVFFVIGVGFAWSSARRLGTTTSAIDLAGLWIAMPLVGLMMLHKLSAMSLVSPIMERQLTPSHAIFQFRTIVLLVLLPVWAGDIAALFVGKAVGGRLLWPSLSPKKTVAGALANLVAATAAAWGVAFIVNHAPVFRLPLAVYLCCGVAASIAGQGGDLFESYIKRCRGYKDSGDLLPGHGGLLDRIDSLLFAAPVVTLILVLWPRG